MQNSWNFAAGVWWRRWAAWLTVLFALALIAGACTGKIEGVPYGNPGPGAASLGPGAPNTLQCQPGLTACNNVCVNLQSASDNCGMCGVACTAPAVCANGNC